ncbi:heterokaryon incompatibility protein-domain-containing protein [Xylogone sp. PMI_703]|nr:heterokaryon incompatibility protein-domain-containing protein [Xylogone sp. PMI_703]
MASKYEYTPLEKDSHVIRLITILPGAFGDELHCNCLNTKLEDAPVYECLSYAWGLPNFSSSILIDGHTLPITPNLEEALRHLRYPYEKRVMWIDAICINQAANEERSSQVQIMGEIYSRARQTIVWIGPRDETSDRAINFLRNMARERALELSNTWYDGVRQGSSPGPEFEDDDEDEDKIKDQNNAVLGEDGSEAASWDPLRRRRFLRLQRVREQEWEYNKANVGHITFGIPVLYENSYYRFFADDKYLEDWSAVDKLFSRSWFSRTWVVQEVWKSSAAMLQCGYKTLPWTVFELSMSYSEAWDDMGASIQGTAREKDWTTLKRRYSLATHISNKRLLGSNLNSLLWNTWDRESTDPLDKVYAILGLVGEESKGMITPDYSKSMGVVYRETAREIIRGHKSLDILLAACGPTRQDGLPSWVPDWRHSANQNRPTLFVNRKRLLTMYYHGSMESVTLHGHGYKAAGNTPAVFDFDSQLDILKVLAHLVDTVAEVDVVHPLGATAEDILSATCSFVRSSQHAWLPRIKPKLKQEIKMLLVAGCVHHNADQVLVNTMRHRRFFVTKWGDMCIGPAATVPGDQVFIIAGCNFPLILRREGQSYIIVGDAYGMSYIFYSWANEQ